MSKASKVWLIVAAALVLCGAILFTCALAGMNWDFNNLSTDNYETKVYEFDEALQDIHITTSTADIEIIASGENSVKVVCYESAKEPHRVYLSDGVLTVEYEDMNSWIDHIGISYDTSKVTVYLPEGTWGKYGDLNIKTSTGDVVIPRGLGFDAMDIVTSTGDVNTGADVFGSMKVTTSTGDIYAEGIYADSMELSASTGDISLENVECENQLSLRSSTGGTEIENVSCKSFLLDGDTGDIFIEGLKAYSQMSIESGSGDVVFRSCESPLVRIDTDTGEVYGSFASDMVFYVETDTGDVNVPRSVAGGNCYINTDTGDIRIEIDKDTD